MFFLSGLHPHVPRALLRLVQGPAGDDLAARLRHLPADDGHGLHGLRAADGSDVVPRRGGDHQRDRRHSGHRSGHPDTGCRAAPAVDEPTLRRFFSLHYLLPFAILGVVVLHLWALHTASQNNPVGILIPKERTTQDTLPFHPYFTVKDGFAATRFLIMFAVFVFPHAERLWPTPTTTSRPTPAHAGADRARVVPVALLRHAARHPGQGGRGVHDVRLAGPAVPVALARPVEGALHALPGRRCADSSSIFVVNCLFLGWCGANEPDGQVIPGLKTITVGDGDLNSFLWLARFLTAYYSHLLRRHHTVDGAARDASAGAGSRSSSWCSPIGHRRGDRLSLER